MNDRRLKGFLPVLIACFVHVAPSFAQSEGASESGGGPTNGVSAISEFETSLGGILDVSSGGSFGGRAVGEQSGVSEGDAFVPHRPGYWNDFDPYLAVQRSAPAVGVTSESPRSADAPFTKDELKEVEALITQLKKDRLDACRAHKPTALENVQAEFLRLKSGLEATRGAAEASLSDVQRELHANQEKLDAMASRRTPLREELENQGHALDFDAHDLRERSARASLALGTLRELSLSHCDLPLAQSPSNLRPHRTPRVAEKSGSPFSKDGPSHGVIPKLKPMKSSLRP